MSRTVWFVNSAATLLPLLIRILFKSVSRGSHRKEKPAIFPFKLLQASPPYPKEMDIILLIIGLFCCFLGVFGSFLPVLPGPPVSWLGLLLLILTSAVPNDWWLIVITGIVAFVVVALDYWIPAVGTRKFGGSRAGMIGTTIGLLVAIVFPVLGIAGIVIWPFVGAIVGELINKTGHKQALKAAFGSFVGFLTGTFLKFVVSMVYLGIFIFRAWDYRAELFPFLN